MQFIIPDTTNTLDLAPLLDIARKAGAAILDIYGQPENIGITYKADESPLTLADAAAHAVIVQALALYTPHIPVLSEEGSDVAYEIRSAWPLYWCVDPLDGTKEFIKRNGEFTVNIALIQGNGTVLGVIYQPVGDHLYVGGKGLGSYKVSGANEDWQRLQVRHKTENIIAVGSRTHSDPAEEKILAQFAVSQFIAAGSSLKFCLLAEGSAQLYYRHGPTMEWDTAAGQAIAEAAGATMTTPEGEPFTYNKQSLRNGSFICKA